MTGNKCFWCKVVTLSIVGGLNAFLLFASFNVDYQWLLAEEHTRFRRGFPSQANWIASPNGTLRCYLFNVTNAEAFLNGTDSKIKLQEVGPISYHIKGRNRILKQTDSTLTYEKMRYDQIEFDPIGSSSPDILNKTVILPNFLLLGSAAKFHDWVFLVRHVFNAVTINESPFLKRSIYYFLWEFTTPTLNLLANYVPNIKSNCGILYNALRQKDEVYDVKIGVNNGLKNFFRVNLLNNITHFPEQTARMKALKANKTDLYCPIDIADSFDNSLFPPFIDVDDKIDIVATEACRILRLVYNETVSHLGFSGYRYIFDTSPSCFDNSMGIKLHRGMFDVANCLINDVPAAFSAPHFYGSSYNWSEHFEGLAPKKAQHEASIIIEPITGIPIEESYRFQSNIPMPEMTGYNRELARFNKMVVPSFWYEYDLDELYPMVLFLMYLNVYVAPIAQPILMGLYFIVAIYCALKIYLLVKGIHFDDLIREYVCAKRKPLQSTFSHPTENEQEPPAVQTKY